MHRVLFLNIQVAKVVQAEHNGKKKTLFLAIVEVQNKKTVGNGLENHYPQRVGIEYGDLFSQ